MCSYFCLDHGLSTRIDEARVVRGVLNKYSPDSTLPHFRNLVLVVGAALVAAGIRAGEHRPVWGERSDSYRVQVNRVLADEDFVAGLTVQDPNRVAFVEGN